MPSTASNRLHIVVLSTYELDDQMDLGRDTISFAVDRGAESPGLGRVAVVVTHDLRGEVGITHLGWVKAGPRRTNLDSTWVLSAVHELSDPILFTEIEAELGRSSAGVLKAARSRRGGALTLAGSSKLRAALQSRVAENEWPGIDGTPEWMTPRIDGHIRQDHTNAIGTALMFSGMDVAEMRYAPLPGESPLRQLRLSPSEASLIDNDLRNFPGMSGEAHAEDIFRFTDEEHTLDVMNVNATGIESATGVDLIYFSHDYDCYVLVQYKRMDNEAGGRIAGVDARLADQLRRMVAFDALSHKQSGGPKPTTFRLGAGATYTKFAYPVVSPQRESDLTNGMYVPSELLKRLHDGDHLIGPRGGAAITHSNLRRWLSNSQFAALVKMGWVGSSGLSAADINDFVRSSLNDGRIAVIAAHSSAS